jgi:hypothetical protein
MQCEYQYGEFEMAVGPRWTDETGRCNIPAETEVDGEQYCYGHAVILTENL